MGLATAAFRLYSIFPYYPAPVLASGYTRASEQDPEMEDRVANPCRIHTGTQVMTSPESLNGLVGVGLGCGA
jgi:hypothetical protein